MSSSSSSSKNNNVGITAFRRNIEPTETLAGLCIKYNIAMADIHRANNGTLVNENTAHAKGWVMIPYFDRDGKKINNDSETKPSSSSSEKAIDKLRRHYQLPGTPEKGTTTKTNTSARGRAAKKKTTRKVRNTKRTKTWTKTRRIFSTRT